jgi:predicted adenine nucleotide alpha hydrolase (AANH) superfamily ATPase
LYQKLLLLLQCIRQLSCNRFIMNKRNFQAELDDIIKDNETKGVVPTLLLHSCCAPCSSYTLEYLSQYFNITVYYYNPNIYPEEEFHKRVEEEKRLISELPTKHPVKMISGDYEPKEFYDIAKGLENVAEGGERCFRCYRLRLEKTAQLARDMGFDYFTTTLSISPLKRSEKINEIGDDVANSYGVKFLPSDFKKRGGFLRSIQLSKDYNLYRQNYCGCIFSQRKNE